MIKKFNELFDSPEMKDFVLSEDPSAEIDFLRKDYKKYAKVDWDFKEQDIKSFLNKLIEYKQPFFSVFLDADDKENGVLEFEDFDVVVRYDEAEDTYAFIIADERFMLVLQVKIMGEKYDITLLLDDLEADEDELYVYEEKGITFNQVFDIIGRQYVIAIDQCGFTDILNYNHIQNLQTYN